ncbi:S-layer homology domain-containing protein [Oscillospiraceae bacterium 50-16]
MKKKIASFLLALVMCLGLLPTAAFAVQSDDLTISFKTAVYSISKETFVRWVDEPASQGECGPDEYVTVCPIVKNTSGAAVTLQNIYVRIDGGEELRWAKDITLEPGKSVQLYIYHSNEKYLTPGLHTAALYAGDALLASGRFSIGRDWPEIFKFPSEEQVAARPADRRSLYLSTWLSVDSDVRYDAYCVDFKSDHIPYGTYSAVFNGYMDYSSLKEQYVSVDNGGHIGLYGGLQQGAEGKESNSILTMWDIYCTDKNGKKTIIHPERTYTAEKTDIDKLIGGAEGEGSQTLLPYNWQAGRWYRMLLRCGASETTGNTTVEQWFQDLTTGDWTHMCTYDIGVKNSCFKGSMAVFSENFLKQYAGGVRSLEFTNVRIHTSEGWRDVTSTGPIKSRVDKTGVLADIYGSWEAGTDDSTFYMISTGVPGWGRTENTGKLTVQNRESGDPLNGKPLKETVRFDDVPAGVYYYDAVQWAVDQGVASGTGDGKFSPNSTCTQGQILTFLWRAYGSPTPSGKVSGNEYYAVPLQWAKEKKLVDGNLSAKDPCTRSDVVTYLWKLAGSPSAKAAGFSDVPASASYAGAVNWAVENKITSGTGPDTFSPDKACTRGQIVTFLYQALK